MDPGGGTRQHQPPSYADRLKTNIKFDQRLKRNILEIVIEKSEREAEIVLNPDTVARVFRSVGLNIETQVEGYQIQFGRVCILSVWVEKSVNLERFCKVENIMVSKGVMTGSIWLDGRKDVLVTVAVVLTPSAYFPGHKNSRRFCRYLKKSREKRENV